MRTSVHPGVSAAIGESSCGKSSSLQRNFSRGAYPWPSGVRTAVDRTDAAASPVIRGADVRGRRDRHRLGAARFSHAPCRAVLAGCALQSGAMRRLRAQRQPAAWIAVLAILLASLVPSLSHALAAGNAASWVAVCSTKGSTWLLSDADPSPAGSGPAHLLEHCPYCTIHAPVLALPPSLERTTVKPSHTDGFQSVVRTDPRTDAAWLSAQPRGPPRLT
jgi:hypothetical protein